MGVFKIANDHCINIDYGVSRSDAIDTIISSGDIRNVTKQIHQIEMTERTDKLCLSGNV